MSVRCHFCEFEHCDQNNSVTTCWTNKYCLKSTVLENDGYIAHKRGCDDSGLTCGLYFKQKNVHQNIQIECCNLDFCNSGPFVDISMPKEFSTEENIYIVSYHLIAYALLCFWLLLAIVICFVYFYKRRNKKCSGSSDQFHMDQMNAVEKEYLNSDYKPEIRVTAPGDSTLGQVIDESVTSGSGSGYPKLIQRTFSKQIDLIECVGKGRYGEVWKGIFLSEEVAVKIFFSRDEASWMREIIIYSTIMLKHENILPFIGSDVTSVNSCTQLWLVTTYFELGSLFDFLNDHTLSLEDMFSVMLSIVSGITHLHTEIFGTQGKPAIAHRDIKSKNILMKTPNICCIADFGLAVTHEQTGTLNIPSNYRVGTKRYMAPEVLEGTLKENSFQSYTIADIYSLSLVLWEIIRRTEYETNAAYEYEVPYQDMVPSDPSFDDMRKVVCIDQHRPEIPKEYNLNEAIKTITYIIRESWSTNPSSRLSALRIKKTLIKLKHMTFGNNLVR